MIFFSLSGYILSHIYYDNFRSPSMAFLRDYRDFLWKRIARIYPLHVFLLILMLVLFPRFSNVNSGLRQLFTNLTLTHGWTFDALSFVGASWSISVEFFFYLLFPFMMLVGNRRRALIVFVLLGFLFVWVSIYAYQIPEEWRRYFTHRIFSYGAYFVFGVCVFFLAQYRVIRALLDNDFAFTALAALIIFICGYAYTRSPKFSIFVMAFAIPPLVRSVHKSRIANYLLGGVVMVWLGDLSYSIYLSHLFIQQLVHSISQGQSRDPLYEWGSIYLLLIVWCLFCYHVIELPARKKLRRVFNPNLSEC